MSRLQDVARYFAVLLAISCCRGAAAQPNPTRKVWFEYGLASLMTGRLPSGLPVGLKIYVVATGPNFEDKREATIRERNRAVVPGLVQTLTDTLDRRIPSLSERLEKVPQEKVEGERKVARAQLVGDVAAAVATMQRGYEAKVGGTPPSVQNGPRVYNLALVVRSCDGTPGSCTLGSFAVSKPNRSTDRFGKVYQWLKPAVAGRVNTFAIVDTASKSPLAQPFVEATVGHWKPLPNSAVRVAQLEVAVAQARRSQGRLNAVVPEVVGIGQTSAVRFVDVLSNPSDALQDLARDQGSTLAHISDELARARLTDCARLRGSTKPEDVMACAGYKGDAASVAECLSGKRCFPIFGDRTIVDVALINNPGSLKELIEQSAGPRVHLGPIAEIEKAGRECAKKHPRDQTAAMTCLLGARRSPADRAAIECAQRNASAPSAKSLLACVPVGKIPTATRAQIDCAVANSHDAKGLALCSAMSALPPASREIARCASRHGMRSDVRSGLTCLALASGSPDMKIASGCVEQHGKDWKAAALCAAAAKGGLPPDVSKAMACAQSGSSMANVGVCLVQDKLPPEIGNAAQCYVTGGGNPTAMAVCMASDGLTQDQRIALQCAAQSGGVPATWAVCTGGQLAWKEFNNCRGGRAFEDKCFGKGNDLRRFAEGITGSEVGPNSVVASIVNVYIKFAEFNVGGAEAVMKGGQHVVNEAGKVLEEERKKVERVVKNPADAVSDCARTPFNCIR